MPHNPEKLHDSSKGNPLKQVIVIRRDLKMRRGKEIAQGAHAAMAFLTCRLQPFIDDTRDVLRGGATFSSDELAWMRSHFKKVVVIVNSEEELLEIHDKALAVGLVSYLITDSGKTEFGGIPTHTCCGIGPDHQDKINPITGHLKLY